MHNATYKLNKKIINFFIIYLYIKINKVIYISIYIKNYFFKKILFFKLFKLINFAKIANMANFLKNLKINLKINRGFNFFKFENTFILFINDVTLIFGNNKLKNKYLLIIIKIEILFNKLKLFIIRQKFYAKINNFILKIILIILLI